MKIVLYCLTCDPYRKNFMEQQFIKYNFNYNFYDAVKCTSLVNYKNIVAPVQDTEDKLFLVNYKHIAESKKLRISEVSIALGHYFITRTFMESNNDILVFCEDDVVFIDHDINKTITAYIENENIMDKPFIIYGCIIRNADVINKVPDLHRLEPCGPAYGNPCYIINKKFAQIILENFSPITTSYDDYVRNLIRHNNVSCFYTAPFICYELSSHYYHMYHTPEDLITKQHITRLSCVDINENTYKNVQYSTSNNVQWNSLLEYMLKHKKRGNYSPIDTLDSEHLLFGGSMDNCNNKSIVCGSGITNQTDTIVEPYLILSCRGPLTRKRIIESGYYCPNNYGDPALLISHLYPISIIDKTNKIGIIISDKSLAINAQCMILDFDDIEKLISNMLKCEVILSDTLCGLIIAHSYGLSAIWITNDHNEKNDHTEFLDYYQSLDIFDVLPLTLNDNLINNDLSTYPNPTSEKITNTINNIRKWTP